MLILLLTLSFIFNIICILPYFKFYFKKFYGRYFDKPFFGENDKDENIISAVVNFSLSISHPIMVQQEFRGLFFDIKSYFSPRRNSSIVNNFYTSYLYAGLSQYTLRFKDNVVLNHIEQKANLWINEKELKLNYVLQRVDQYPIGILYINLFRITKNLKYRIITEHIYNSILENRCKNSNIVKYNKDENNYVDVLGMIVPFLMEYYDLTKDSLAYTIAKDNIEEFYKYGVDKETGIPSHGYNSISHIKVGSNNWGRGIGWYLLANAYCSNTNINKDIIDRNLKNIPYSQFPKSKEDFDSSVALMIEIYKQSKGKRKNISLDFIKQHIRKNGIIDHCSGDTYNFNYYSNTSSESEFCNGLLLLLLSKFNY